MSADATIARAEQGLLSGTVQSIRTTGTQLAIDVRTNLGVVVTLQGQVLSASRCSYKCRVLRR